MKAQICKNCSFFTAYYKQNSDGFSRLNHGFCSKLGKPQIQSETCGGFKSSELKDKRWDRLRLHSLEYALRAINEIAQILKEKNASD